MRFQPIIAFALMTLGAFAAPAAAQQDERFYGRWEPMSRGTGDNILYIDPDGTISFLRPSGEYSVERYQVIRDFGKRVIVRAWKLGKDEQAYNVSVIVVLEYVDDDFLTYNKYDYITYYYCMSDPAEAYFFSDHDPDNIWRRILEWSARAEEGSSDYNCYISPEGEFLDFWSGVSWARYFDQAEK